MGHQHWVDRNGAGTTLSWVPYSGMEELPSGLMHPEQQANAAAVRVRFKRKLQLYADKLLGRGHGCDTPNQIEG